MYMPQVSCDMEEKEKFGCWDIEIEGKEMEGNEGGAKD